MDNNKETDIEIRSSDAIIRPFKILKEKPDELWSFAEHPKTLKPKTLKDYWENYIYMDTWRKLLT